MNLLHERIEGPFFPSSIDFLCKKNEEKKSHNVIASFTEYILYKNSSLGRFSSRATPILISN